MVIILSISKVKHNNNIMNNFDIYRAAFEDEDQELPHLPLDWNEELSLEEYLERVERRADAIMNKLND